MSLDLHYSILLAQELERTAGEPLTSCYLMPEDDGHRLVREPVMQVLQRMDLSSIPASATCSLKTPSDRLLGFAYYPRDQRDADRLAARLEPSFVVDADIDLHEMTYLIEGTNDEIDQIRALIDVDGDADCRTAGLFLIPFKGGSLATPWRAMLDDGLPLKVHTFEAVMSMITAFQE